GFTAGTFPTSVDGGPANRYAAGTFDFVSVPQFVSGTTTAVAGVPYLLNLTQLPGIASWNISWGDGQTDVLAGSPAQASHTYATSGNYLVAATATDIDGHVFGTQYLSVTSSANPAAYWRLDETSLAPPTVQDVTGNFDATYVNFQVADLGQAGALRDDP